MKSPLSLLAPAIFLGTATLPLGAQVYMPPPPTSLPAERDPAASAGHAFFGVVTETLPEATRHHLPILPPAAGLLVREADPVGPAAASGIGQSDILVRWNDHMLVHPAQLEVLVAAAKPGDKVTVGYLRRGKMTKADVILGVRPAAPPPPARPDSGLHFEQAPDGKSFRLDIDLGKLENALREVNPEDLLRNIDLDALIRDLDLERRLGEIENTIRELDLENRLNELMQALGALNLEGIGQEGILGLLRELNRQQAPPPVEPGAAPEAPAPRALPDLLQQIDPETLRDAAKSLDLENIDPALVDGVLRKIQRDGIDPETLKKAAASFGIEDVDPKIIEEAVKTIDPAVIQQLLQGLGGAPKPAPPAEAGGH